MSSTSSASPLWEYESSGKQVSRSRSCYLSLLKGPRPRLEGGEGGRDGRGKGGRGHQLSLLSLNILPRKTRRLVSTARMHVHSGRKRDRGTREGNDSSASAPSSSTLSSTFPFPRPRSYLPLSFPPLRQDPSPSPSTLKSTTVEDPSSCLSPLDRRTSFLCLDFKEETLLKAVGPSKSVSPLPSLSSLNP